MSLVSSRIRSLCFDYFTKKTCSFCYSREHLLGGGESGNVRNTYTDLFGRNKNHVVKAIRNYTKILFRAPGGGDKCICVMALLEYQHFAPQYVPNPTHMEGKLRRTFRDKHRGRSGAPGVLLARSRPHLAGMHAFIACLWAIVGIMQATIRILYGNYTETIQTTWVCFPQDR